MMSIFRWRVWLEFSMLTTSKLYHSCLLNFDKKNLLIVDSIKACANVKLLGFWIATTLLIVNFTVSTCFGKNFLFSFFLSRQPSSILMTSIDNDKHMSKPRLWRAYLNWMCSCYITYCLYQFVAIANGYCLVSWIQGPVKSGWHRRSWCCMVPFDLGFTFMVCCYTFFRTIPPSSLLTWWLIYHDGRHIHTLVIDETAYD